MYRDKDIDLMVLHKGTVFFPLILVWMTCSLHTHILFLMLIVNLLCSYGKKEGSSSLGLSYGNEIKAYSISSSARAVGGSL